MQQDERCCGTGTCIVDASGTCWCGQRWDGEKMCNPASAIAASAPQPASPTQPDTATGKGETP